MAKGNVRYSCIAEVYDLDIGNQELLVNCSKLGGIVLLSFWITDDGKLHITIDPQSNIQISEASDGFVHNCEVIEKDWEQIKSMQGPTGCTGPTGCEEE